MEFQWKKKCKCLLKLYLISLRSHSSFETRQTIQALKLMHLKHKLVLYELH